MDIDFDELIRLTDAKKHGKSYRAKCELHNGDSKTSLQITETPTGVWAYCHVCHANTFDIARHYDLWEREKLDKLKEDKYPKYPKNHDREKDYHIVSITESTSDRLTIYDKIAYKKAKRRIEIHNDKVQKWFAGKPVQ